MPVQIQVNPPYRAAVETLTMIRKFSPLCMTDNVAVCFWVDEQVPSVCKYFWNRNDLSMFRPKKSYSHPCMDGCILGLQIFLAQEGIDMFISRHQNITFLPMCGFQGWWDVSYMYFLKSFWRKCNLCDEVEGNYHMRNFDPKKKLSWREVENSSMQMTPSIWDINQDVWYITMCFRLMIYTTQKTLHKRRLPISISDFNSQQLLISNSCFKHSCCRAKTFLLINMVYYRWQNTKFEFQLSGFITRLNMQVLWDQIYFFWSKTDQIFWSYQIIASSN